MKLNNTTLFIILGILLGLYLLQRLVRTPSTERTFKTDIVQVDTSQVTTLSLFPAAQGGTAIDFQKTNGIWTLTSAGIQTKPSQGIVEGLLTQLLRIQPNRLASNRAAKWDNYSVGDSTGTRVLVKEGNKTTLDIVVGKTTFQQQQMQAQQFQQQQQMPKGTSYVRLSGEEEVYATEGFLEMTFNRDFNSFRDKAFLQLDKNNITSLQFSYAEGEPFTVQKLDTNWTLDGIAADSTKIANYLGQLSYKQGSNFANNFSAAMPSTAQLSISGNNMANVVIKAWQKDSTTYVLHSSTNPNSYFEGTTEDLFGQLFVEKSAFLE